MDPQLAKYLMIGAVFFGAFVLVPIVMALLSHQQRMTRLLNKSNEDAEQIRSLLAKLDAKLDALATPRRFESAELVPEERQTLQL